MKIFYILLIAIGGFILNIGLYYVNEDYRLFLKNLKSEEPREIVTDEYRIDSSELDISLEDELDEDFMSEDGTEKFERNEDQLEGGDLEIVSVEPKYDGEIIKMSQTDTQILNLFSSYNLTELQSHGSLLDITKEYPDKYFEYYTLDLTIVFFPSKTYEQVREIFKVVSYDGLFSINELDNFGEESFYINLGETYDDGYIRLIISNNGTTFGLKISKNEYNRVKEILKKI